MIVEISSNQKEWNTFVKSCSQFDFYHTASYHRLAEDRGEGTPLLWVYKEQEYSLGLPLLIRSIDEMGNWRRCDATSVYGYSGPISSHNVLPKDFIQNFQQALKHYCRENKIVSVFARLHTLWNQKTWLEGLGETEDLGKTISIDLTLPLEQQRAKYRKSNKSEINQLRRSVKCRKAETAHDIEQYVEIYLENMRRVDAAKQYFFSREYFDRLLNAEDFECFILFAENDVEIMAGAMFTISNDIVQYHLAGTKAIYLKMTPMKLILDEMRIIASNMGLKHFHLGGGVGSTEDSLFRFKSGFSDIVNTFSVWKWIVDTEEYDNIVKTKFGDVRPNSRYFPLYRSIP